MSEKDEQEKKARLLVIEEEEEDPPAATTGTAWRYDPKDWRRSSQEDSTPEDEDIAIPNEQLTMNTSATLRLRGH